jgi:hypothetical protein
MKLTDGTFSQLDGLAIPGYCALMNRGTKLAVEDAVDLTAKVVNQAFILYLTLPHVWNAYYQSTGMYITKVLVNIFP